MLMMMRSYHDYFLIMLNIFNVLLLSSINIFRSLLTPCQTFFVVTLVNSEILITSFFLHIDSSHICALNSFLRLENEVGQWHIL